MFYVDNPTGVPVMPPLPPVMSLATLYFTEGGNGIPPTYPGPDWFNITQSELINVVKEAGMLPVKAELNQLVMAIKRIIGTAMAEDALMKVRNGADIPDKDLFVRNVGAARAFSGAISIGEDSAPWTTAEFIVWLESQGAFNHPYWMCKGSWAYNLNKTITDTGCGDIQLAGAVVEVMGVRGAMTIRVTTASAGAGILNAQFTYCNNGEGYYPGWHRDFNTANKPTAADVSALALSPVSFSTGTDFNNAPAGSTSFVYSGIPNSPPEHCAVLDWWGLGQGYRGQIGAGYHSGKLYFRTRNGDDNNWSTWQTLYSTNNPQPVSFEGYATQQWVLQNTVQDIDHTAPTEFQFWDGRGYMRPTDGAAMYNFQMVGGSSNVGYIQIRYTRKLVNGTWYIIN